MTLQLHSGFDALGQISGSLLKMDYISGAIVSGAHYGDGSNLSNLPSGGGGSNWLSGGGYIWPVDVSLYISGAAIAVSGGLYLIEDHLNTLTVQNQTAGQMAGIRVFTKDSDGTDGCFIQMFGKGDPTDITNNERLSMGWSASDNYFNIRTQADGTGSSRLLNFEADGQSEQLQIRTDGSIDISGAITYKGEATETRTESIAAGDQIVIKDGLVIEYNPKK